MIELSHGVTSTHVWLALDPETRRVTAQTREWGDGDFPRGLRGVGWPRRETDVPAEALTQIARAEITPDEVDQLHRQWWDDARPDPNDPLWPEVPQ